MKKFLYISFAIIFSLLTIGILINKHYSEGELFSFALIGDADSCCDVPCDCCDDESEMIQFAADYLFSVHYIVDLNISNVEPIANYTLDLLSPDKGIYDFGMKYMFSDIPPPELKTFLSQVQTFLL